jgi:hypothetical protein
MPPKAKSAAPSAPAPRARSPRTTWTEAEQKLLLQAMLDSSYTSNKDFVKAVGIYNDRRMQQQYAAARPRELPDNMFVEGTRNMSPAYSKALQLLRSNASSIV